MVLTDLIERTDSEGLQWETLSAIKSQINTS